MSHPIYFVYHVTNKKMGQDLLVILYWHRQMGGCRLLPRASTLFIAFPRARARAFMAKYRAQARRWAARGRECPHNYLSPLRRPGLRRLWNGGTSPF